MKRKRGRRSPLKKIHAVIHIGRPLNATMVFFTALAGGIIAGLDPLRVIIPALSAALISMGAQAVNDYFDVEVDKRRKRRRPLVTGSLSLREALYVWTGYFILGIILALLASPIHLAVALAAVLLAYLYSRYIQSRKFVGNIVVSILVALSIIYGGIGGNVDKLILPAIIVFFVNWGREILKDVADGGTDYPRKISLFHILGRHWSIFFASYMVFLGIILIPFPYLLGHLSLYYLVIMVLAALIALFAVAESLQEKVERAETVLKVAMIVAILALYAGVLG